LPELPVPDQLKDGRASNRRPALREMPMAQQQKMNHMLDIASGVAASGPGQQLPSPDPHAGLWCQAELVARLHAESVIPSVHISDDAIDPELLRSVRIRHQ